MKAITVRIHSEEAHILPIGDIHIGDKSFGKVGQQKLKERIDFVKKHKHAYIVLMGDIINVATRQSKTSPFSQDLTLQEQIDQAVKWFEPVKDKIIGAIDGNHEARLIDFTGYSPTISICDRLGVPYFGTSVLIDFVVGTKKNRLKSHVGYFHHSTGGGTTVGAAINRADKLRRLVVNADFYAIGHNHHLGVSQESCVEYDNIHHRLVFKKQTLINCGSFLEWDGSYAESKMYAPNRLGSPIITIRSRGERNFEVLV